VVRGGTFASIDVGTTKVCTVVGEVTAGAEMRILGVGVAPAAGLSRGMVENIRDATESIRASLDKAERSSGTRILSAHVGISGVQVGCQNNRGIVAIPDRDHPITNEDVARAIDTARIISIPTNREILHVIPRYYVVDGQDSVTDPVGMYGQRLDVETHLVTGLTTAGQNLAKCVEAVGVQVDSLILGSLAAAEAVLDGEEKRQGVVLADVGGGTTDVAVFVDGSVFHCAVLPVGGTHLTRDLVIGLRCPFPAAEEAKARHGHAIPSNVEADEEVELEAFGSDGRKSVPRRRVCEIIQARTEEILEMILSEVKRAVHDDIISAGLVLTGGTANLPGIEPLAEEVTGLPARVGIPRRMQGLTETLSNPAYAASVGLLQWAVREAEAGLPDRRQYASLPLGAWWRRLSQWVRVWLPQ
jgi:cell division protein FtsA